jgi:hypothetical protein
VELEVGLRLDAFERLVCAQHRFELDAVLAEGILDPDALRVAEPPNLADLEAASLSSAQSSRRACAAPSPPRSWMPGDVSLDSLVLVDFKNQQQTPWNFRHLFATERLSCSLVFVVHDS